METPLKRRDVLRLGLAGLAGADRMTEFTVLVVGATGSIGRHAVAESLRRGLRTRALVRDASRGAALPADAEIVVGDLASAATLAGAVEGVDGIVFTHGSHGGAEEAEHIDYGAVRNVLDALGTRPSGADRAHDGDRRDQAHPWPRLEAPGRTSRARQWSAVHDRAPRLVRLQRELEAVRSRF